MNAARARKISRKNSSKIANIQLEEVVQRLNEKIQTAAEAAYVSIRKNN